MDYQEIAKQAFNDLNHKNFISAEKKLKKLLKKYPAEINFLNALAYVNFSQKKILDSINLLKKSLLINPSQHDCIKNLVINQMEINKYEDALETIEKSIDRFQKSAYLFYLRGNIFLKLDKIDEAIESYLNSTELDFEFKDSYLNLGYAYNKNRDYQKAISAYIKLIQLDSNSHDAHYNLAIAYNNIGSYGNAILHYETALKINPINEIAKFNLSILYLTQMRFAEGWPLWENRWYELQKPEFTTKINSCSSLDKSKKILIWGEQAIGEQILYGSMLKDLNDFKNLTVAVHKKLLPIYQRSINNIKFIDLENILEYQNYDYQIAMGSLGSFLRPDEKSFKNQPQKFLINDSKQSKKFKDKLEFGGKIVCGLSWISKNQFIGNHKSIKLDQMLSAFDLDKFEFINLQYGDTDHEIKEIEKKYGVKIKNINDLDKFEDIDGLLSLINVCDLVVTVSNVTAHLSGALGKKTFVLSPLEYGSMWHWHIGSKSPWYPSIKILRKKIDHSWDEPLKELYEDLKKIKN